MHAKPLLLVVVALVLGVTSWFWLQNGNNAPAQPVTPAKHDAGNHAAVGGTGDAAAGTVDGDGATAGNPAAAAADRVEAPTTGDPSVAARSVVIRGRLVDGDDAPRAAAALRYGTWHNPAGADYIARMNEDTPRHDLTTAGDGSFEFALDRDFTAMLELPDDEYVFDPHPALVHGRNGDQDLGPFVVRRSATVSGIVQDQRGVPVAGVNVSAAAGLLAFATTSSAVSGEDGRFVIGKLRPGVWMVRTASARYLPASHEVTIMGATRIDDLVLTLAQGRAIAGQVVDDLGRPVAGIKVGAKRAEALGNVDIERFSADEATATDEHGLFTLAGLEGETATVRAFGNGHSSVFAADVPVGTGNLVLRVQRLASIAGVLQATDGAPLAGSRVRAVPAGNNDMLSAHGIEGMLADRAPSAKTAADGSFRIEGVKPGPVTLIAEGSTHRPARQAGFQVRPAETTDGVRLIANRGASARITVKDENGEVVAKARVRADAARNDAHNGAATLRSRRVEAEDGDVRVFDPNQALGTAETDADGVAFITGLQHGSIAFSAAHPDFAAAKVVTLPLLPNGTVEVTLTVRVPGFADVSVLHVGGAGPVAAASFRVRPLGNDGTPETKGRSDAEGRALIGPLAAGSYVAELLRPPTTTRVGGSFVAFGDDDGDAIGGSGTRFSITAGNTTPVRLQRPVLTRLFGVVTGGDGPIGDCSVELQKDDPEHPSIPGMGGGRTVTTAADGTFSLDDVEPGRYLIEYGRLAQIVKAEVRLTVPPDVPELRHDLALLTGRLRVQAWSTASDSAIANAEVEISRVVPAAAGGERRQTRMMMVTISTDDDNAGDSTMMTIGSQRQKTGADGWAEVEDVPVGDYVVRITHKKYAPVEKAAVAISEMQTLDIGRVGMSQAGSIRGKVVAADGGAVRMALVYHRSIDGEEGQPTPAMGGSFNLGSLPTGRYVLRARAMSPGGGGPGEFGPEVEVEVEAGVAAPARLSLPAK